MCSCSIGFCIPAYQFVSRARITRSCNCNPTITVHFSYIRNRTANGRAFRSIWIIAKDYIRLQISVYRSECGNISCDQVISKLDCISRLIKRSVFSFPSKESMGALIVGRCSLKRDLTVFPVLLTICRDYSGSILTLIVCYREVRCPAPLCSQSQDIV